VCEICEYQIRLQITQQFGKFAAWRLFLVSGNLRPLRIGFFMNSRPAETKKPSTPVLRVGR
jgi:hypothetical protein